MVEPDSLVLEQLRAMRGENAKIINWMQTMTAEMTSMRQFMSGMHTLLEHDHSEIAEIKIRLDRIEKRLELTD
jgi:hypothetical protein